MTDQIETVPPNRIAIAIMGMLNTLHWLNGNAAADLSPLHAEMVRNAVSDFDRPDLRSSLVRHLFAGEEESARLRSRLADVSSPTAIQGIIRRVITRVCELPDRTSPEDWPEAMLVTDEELHHILQEELFEHFK